MTMPISSLVEHARDQMCRLGETVGLGDMRTALELLPRLLGAAGNRLLTEAPLWPSDVADDHTPLEYSIAFDQSKPPALRLLGETIAEEPSAARNAHEFRKLLDSVHNEFELSLDRFERVQDLFLPSETAAEFLLWYSLVLRAEHAPVFKVYFNPAARGPENARELVAEGLRRLGLGAAFQSIESHALARGDADRPAFFAVDLHARQHARVKVYVAHHDSGSAEVTRAARAAGVLDTELLDDFCAVAGRTDRFDRRPLISSYTYMSPDTDVPSGYSLYVPIRDYVGDDEEARERVQVLLDRTGFDSAMLDRAIAALTGRSLADGAGLIAHVSLRLGVGRPGLTVYLSSEAYAVTQPHSLYHVH